MQKSEIIIRLEKRIEIMREISQKEIDKFIVEMHKHPERALTWGGDIFTHAADLRVCELVERQIKNGMAYADIMKSTMHEVIHGARRRERSTSVTSNEMSAEMLAAWARFYDSMKQLSMGETGGAY